MHEDSTDPGTEAAPIAAADSQRPLTGLKAFQNWVKTWVEILKVLVGIVVLLWLLSLGITWGGRTFFEYPSQPTMNPRAEMVAGLMIQVSEAFPGSNPRFEFFEGDNTDVYVPREAFEAIPFPDREKTMRQLCTAWAHRVDASYWPVLRIRDMKNGDTLVRYSARWGRFSMVEVR